MKSNSEQKRGEYQKSIKTAIVLDWTCNKIPNNKLSN